MSDDLKFWRWFENSKVSDKNGDPVAVYHATDREFDKFDVEQCEFGCHFGSHAQAMTIARNSGLTHQSLISAYLSIQNPLRLQDEGDWHTKGVVGQLIGLRIIKKSDVDSYGRLEVGARPFEREPSVVRRFIKSLGYDGIVYLNRAEGLSPADEKKAQKFDSEYGGDEGGLEYLYKELSDNEFKKMFSSAKDSWMVFDSDQVGIIGSDTDAAKSQKKR